MKYSDLKEDKSHGIFNFPMEFYHVDSSHKRYDMIYHWHSEYEIVRILDGELHITLDGKAFFAQKGDIIFISDGSIHSAIPMDCVYECIVFDMKLILRENDICNKELYEFLNHNKIINIKLPNNIDDLNFSLNLLFECMKNKDTAYEFVAHAALYMVLASILKNKLFIESKDKIAQTKDKILQFKKVILYIEENYQEAISLDDLAREAGMCRKYFCKFFKNMSNTTPINYLNFHRIETSAEYLLTSDMPIFDIALNCGFNDLSYYIKTFKKYKNTTPNEYKKNYSSINSKK